MLRKTIIAGLTVALAVCAGCQSHAESKKAAKQRWDKASARIKLVLAQQQYAEADYEKAAETVRQCLFADPDNNTARLLYGKLLLAGGRGNEAIVQLSLALESDKKLHEGWYWLGVAAQENRDYRLAYERYRRALSLQPTNVDYILAVADVQVAQNNCSRALKLFTDKMAALPRNVSLKVAAADLMVRVGDTGRAIRLYERAALLANDSDIAESLGYCYILDGRWKDAAEVFEKLIAEYKTGSVLEKGRKISAPDRQKIKPLLQLLAVCNMNARQYDKAESYYSRLTVQERENAKFWLQMGQAALGAGATNRAFMCAQKALALQPGFPDAIALVGCAQYAGGAYVAAAETFEKISADAENAALAWMMRARCYEQLGQIGRAKRAYKKALQINPHSELGDFLAKAKDI